ncbi:DUF6884 domain-containing protein [Haloarcula salina]|uniref:DUF6884 domain-containing protein n=1 Tax=Haloarcula salina TaxID=1429914 RepID=A0AA41G0X3_9EURY|nr:hypothetical protein [Haloarcula salina]
MGLVSCVKTKRDQPARPRDLYTSTYFEKMRAYAEREHDEWWILSAKHGLLDPDGDLIEPYEKTLTSASVAKRREWASEAVDQMQEMGVLRGDETLVFHAGKAYYEELLLLLEDFPDADVAIPTEGLAIGERVAWYSDRL